ncbi:MAG: SDR family oxidoreductase [Desulfatibacillaceae bacterium]|nr:SDR family oxidoreductase [Desulfatibacillaceae bacterium]
MELTNKAALVLGGIWGIGRAAALALAGQGMKVAVAWYDRKSALDALEKDLAAFGVDFCLLHADLREPEAARLVTQQAVERLGRLDLLVNNVERGGWPVVHGPYTPAQWDLEMQTTLFAKRNIFEACLPFLKRQGGAVINISSIAAKVGRSGPAAGVFNVGYAAANAGVAALTADFARQGAPDVRVNELMLGFFETRHGPGTKGWDLLDEEDKKAILDHTLLGRTGLLDEVAKAIIFLARDASFMTGARLVLDGGYLLGADEAPAMPPGVEPPDGDTRFE